MADLVLGAVTVRAGQGDVRQGAGGSKEGNQRTRPRPARAIKGDDFNARQLRFAALMGSKPSSARSWRRGDSLRGNLHTCHLRPAFREAATAMSSRLLEIAAQRGWPSDRQPTGRAPPSRRSRSSKGVTLKAGRRGGMRQTHRIGRRRARRGGAFCA